MTSLDMNVGGTGTAIQNETEFGSTPLSVDTTSGIGGTGQPVQMELGGTGTALTTEIGGTGTAVGIDSKSDSTAHIDTKSDSHAQVETRSNLDSDSRMLVDLKPMVVDLCTTMNFGRLPDTAIRKPYRHRFCFSMFGSEILAFEMSGESQTYVESLPQPPVVVRGPESGHGRRGGWPQHGSDDPGGHRPGLVIPI